MIVRTSTQLITHCIILSANKCDALRDATLLKVTFFHGGFSRFLNCANGTNSRKASQIDNPFHATGHSVYLQGVN